MVSSELSRAAQRPNPLLAWARATFEIHPPGQWRIVPMEGMRALAVVMVFFAHYSTLMEAYVSPTSLTHVVLVCLHGIGNAGVDLFFLISGYLIYGILIQKPRPIVSYVFRRVQRIYPAFAAVFAIYVVLVIVNPSFKAGTPTDPSALAIYILQCFLLLPGMMKIEPLMAVAWSLSYEFFFYLTLPVVIWALRLRQWPSAARVVFWVLVPIVAIALASVVGDEHLRLNMFVAGILLVETIGAKPTNRPGSAATDVVGLGALVGGLLLTWLWRERMDLFGPSVDLGGFPVRLVVLFVSFYVVALIAFSRDGMCARVFSFTAARWLGNMSYSYYLIHGFSLNIFFFLLRAVWPPSQSEVWIFWGLLPIAFIATLPASVLLFLYVERPWSLGLSPGSAVQRGQAV